MKGYMSAIFIALLLLSSCEVEYREGHRYPHAMGWEHRHYPNHHEHYHHGYHHDKEGNEMEHPHLNKELKP